MAKLTRSGRAGGGRRTGGGGSGFVGETGGGDVESLQEQVALLKVAAGVSDEELTWRMETAKPEANAYRIATAAVEKAEATYERLLWRQGQLEIARARLTGRGAGGDNATAAFASATARVTTTRAPDDRALSRLRSASEAVLSTLQLCSTIATSGKAVYGSAPAKPPLLPADVAAGDVRAAAERVARLLAAVEATASTGSEVDRAAVAAEVSTEAEALAARAEGIERDLRALRPRVEEAVGQVESWRQRRTDAPEFAAEEAALEETWSEANREVNLEALREMRALLPEGMWGMNAGDIQAAAAAAASTLGVGGSESGAGGHGIYFYPSDLCVRLRECRPLHWLVSSPEDIAAANFLVGEGAAAFTQLEGMDLTEMRAVWCVLPKEFSRDADGKKAEWRARFRTQLEGLARQQDGAVITAGWDPVRGRRATCRMPPLPPHRARHPAYFYPTMEAMRARAARLKEQHLRLDARKARLSALDLELAEAKSEVDSACADARSGELRARYGTETLRVAREAAKQAYSTLVRERKTLVVSVAEAERMLSASYPSLVQLESEAESIAKVVGRAQADIDVGDRGEVSPAVVSAASDITAVRVPGAFSSQPELRRRAAATAKKLTPEEERLLRASEVQRAVSSRDALAGAATAAAAPTGGGCGTSGVSAVVSALSHQGGQSGGRYTQEVVVAPGTGEASSLERAAVAASGEDRRGYGGCVAHRAVSRVKAAPGVLAFLTKEYSARSVAQAREVNKKGVVRDAPEAATVSGGTGLIEKNEKVSADITVTAAEGSTNGAIATTLLPLPPLPPSKPISKSLAALLARAPRGTGGGIIGGTGVSSVGDRGSGKAVSPSLGFLDELKARAAAKKGSSPASESSANNAGGGTRAPGKGGGGGRGISAGVVRSGVGGMSFLDELKARNSGLSS